MTSAGAATASAPRGSGEGRATPPHILVVDDDQAILGTIADILATEGYHVDTATDGSAALDSVGERLPSLVLLDMRMPILDGWGFARGLRERGIGLPILVMTAARDAERWAEEIGAAGHLGKPFEMGDLLESVERHCA